MDSYSQFPFHFQRNCLKVLDMLEICFNVNNIAPANEFFHELHFYFVFVIVVMALPD